MTKDYDFIIIGAGPAGMTAAVYASRAGMKTALLEAGAPGGKLLKTHKISNWPGIKEEPGSQLAWICLNIPPASEQFMNMEM